MTHVNIKLVKDGMKDHTAGTVRLASGLFLLFNLFSTYILISCTTLLAGYGESSGTEWLASLVGSMHGTLIMVGGCTIPIIHANSPWC
jgi:hypothetical protein